MGEGDALFPGLLAGVEIALEHQAHNGLAAFTELAEDFARDHTLAPMVFTGVVMGAVDHDGAGDVFAGHSHFGVGHMLGVVVGLPAPATEDDVSVWVARGLNDRRLSLGIDADEVVRRTGRRHRVDRDLQAAFCSVFEADRHRDTAGYFPMRLAFCGAGPDGRPADQVGDVLWADGVEQFRRAGHAGLIDFQQYGPGEFHPGGDVARTV